MGIVETTNRGETPLWCLRLVVGSLSQSLAFTCSIAFHSLLNGFSVDAKLLRGLGNGEPISDIAEHDVITLFHFAEFY